MLSTVLQQLLDKELTTVREIVELTGRGESTVYRWLHGKTQPDFEDMRLLLKKLPQTEARQAILGLFVSDIPIAIDWLTDDMGFVPEADQAAHESALDLSLLALECLVDMLIATRAKAKAGGMDDVSRAQATAHIDAVVRYMALARRAILADGQTRKKAKRIER